MSKIYLMGLVGERHPVGSSHTWMTEYKQPSKILKLGYEMQRQDNEITEVYALKAYPQELCAMSDDDRVYYIRSHGLKILGFDKGDVKNEKGI